MKKLLVALALVAPVTHAATTPPANNDDVENLFGDLTSGRPAFVIGSRQVQNREAAPHNAEDARYLDEVHRAIESRVYPSDAAHGQNCVIDFTLTPAGKMESITGLSGDELACNLVANALKIAALPKPTPELYQRFSKIRFDVRL